MEITRELIIKFMKDNVPNYTVKDENTAVEVCTAYQLNPYKREVHLISAKNKETGVWTFSIIVGYEVYLKRAELSGKLDGHETEHGKDSCTVKVHRKDRKFPTVKTVFLEEYTTGKSLWAKKPKTMLEKVAIAQAYKMAFPVELQGLYTADELPQEILETPAIINPQEPLKTEEPPKETEETILSDKPSVNTNTKDLTEMMKEAAKRASKIKETAERLKLAVADFTKQDVEFLMKEFRLMKSLDPKSENMLKLSDLSVDELRNAFISALDQAEELGAKPYNEEEL